jgi:vancomycin resistance protein YoaR
VLAAAAVAFMLCVSFAGYVIIWPGTTVMGLDVGGLTQSAAKSAIAESLSWSSRQVLLRGNGREMNIFLQSGLGIVPDLDSTVRSCMRPIWRAFSEKEMPLRLTVDEDRFAACAGELAGYFDVPVADARYRIAYGDRVEVVPHQTGKQLDAAALRDMFGASGFIEAVPETLNLSFLDVPPATSTEDLEAHMPLELISSYTTYYAASQTDRAHNISLAASCFSELTVNPGATISFNQIVGPRTPERGYRKAPVIVGDSLQDDYGGGICQVSTTLYVSLLQANFTVTERYCHGLPVGYVPLGLDATVAWDYLDLKMTNPGPAPCIVRAVANQGTLTVDVFGKRIEGLKIEVESRVLKEYPAVPPSSQTQEPSSGSPPGQGTGEPPGEIPPGETPPPGTQPEQPKLRPGYLVETIRRYIRNGRVEFVEKLNTSMYPPEKAK